MIRAKYSESFPKIHLWCTCVNSYIILVILHQMVVIPIIIYMVAYLCDFNTGVNIFFKKPRAPPAAQQGEGVPGRDCRH